MKNTCYFFISSSPSPIPHRFIHLLFTHALLVIYVFVSAPMLEMKGEISSGLGKQRGGGFWEGCQLCTSKIYHPFTFSQNTVSAPDKESLNKTSHCGTHNRTLPLLITRAHA